jgi:hypothetical protein
VTRTVGQAFDVFLERLTPIQNERDNAAQHRTSVEAAINAALTTRGFRQTGSFHHGTGVRHHCDVDVLVSIADQKPSSSDTALGWIKSALQTRFPTTKVRISRPAVVIEFAGGTETWEVIPGFLTTRGGLKTLIYDIPGASTGWLDSAPIEHLNYVDECNKLKRVQGGAKKLARLTKAWKYYNNVPISSFYLEMRAAQHVAGEPSFLPVWDICQLLEKLEGHQLAGMNDPKGAAGRFYACSTDAKKDDARSKLHTAATRARKALDAYNGDKIDTAFEKLDLLFGGRFPAR